MTDQEFEAYNQKLFRKVAPWYRLLDLIAKGCRKRFCRFLDAVEQKAVLDVATGTGKQAIALFKKGAVVTGVDLSADMLRYALMNDQSGKINFVKANGALLPFDNDQFDITVMSFALHCMTQDVRSKTVDEMIRVTKKGGQIAYIDYCKPATIAGKLMYRAIAGIETPLYRKFVESDFQGLAESKGLILVKQEKIYYEVVQMLSFHSSVIDETFSCK